MPPISPMKDGATGKTVKSATLTPLRTLELNEVYQLITANKRLITLTQAIREAALQGDDNNCRMLKQQTLPYVTPCGVFSYRKSDRLTEPSGLIVVDIDHLDSCQEAEKLKKELFDDLLLCPVLTFTSPSGHGVKAFIPYDPARIPDTRQNASENIYWAMNYIEAVYDSHSIHPDKEALKKSHPDKGVDRSGKDLVRACFLSYDKEALMRGEI